MMQPDFSIDFSSAGTQQSTCKLVALHDERNWYFADFCTEKALKMGKHDLFVLVCLVEHLYRGVNVKGCKAYYRLAGYLWFSDNDKGSWNHNVREGQCQGPKLASGRFINGSYYTTKPTTINQMPPSNRCYHPINTSPDRQLT